MSHGAHVKDYRDLRVWQEAMRLAGSTYRATSDLPADERYGLVTQMRRAAVSIPSNIAEGNARHSDREFVRFLRYAYGSACELQTQATICTDIGLADTTSLEIVLADSDRVLASLGALIGRLKHRVGPELQSPKAP